MAEIVVDELEAVEIEQQEGRAVPVVACPQGRLHVAFEAGAVGKARQAIVIGIVCHLPLALPVPVELIQKQRPGPTDPIKSKAEDERHERKRERCGETEKTDMPPLQHERVDRHADYGKKGAESRTRERIALFDPRQQVFQHHVALKRCYHDNRLRGLHRPQDGSRGQRMTEC